jgi:hypothetical protein
MKTERSEVVNKFPSAESLLGLSRQFTIGYMVTVNDILDYVASSNVPVIIGSSPALTIASCTDLVEITGTTMQGNVKMNLVKMLPDGHARMNSNVIS